MNALEFLIKTRKELGLTQKRLAELTGHKTDDIKNYEYKRAKVPGDLVLKLQELLQEYSKHKTKDNKRNNRR